MKTLISATAIVASALFFTNAEAASIQTIDSRIGLGLTPDLQGFPAFFTNGFSQGDTSHTNTISFDDGVVQVDYTVTIEGFDSGGSPAGLIVNNQAAGVELGVVNNQIDPGESIKVTFDDISFSVIGVPPFPLMVDPGTFEALLGSIAFAAFTPGTDTYTYAGVGAGSTVGDDTSRLEFVPHATLSNGDMFTLTADSGAFRALYISPSSQYELIPDPNLVPEPATIGLVGLSMACLAATRRRK